MSRNGSGTYTLPAGNPVVTGTTISSTWANNTLSDIASALTGSVAADGQTPITANIPMNSKKLTGLANPTTAGDALAYGGPVSGTTGAFSGALAGGDLTITGSTSGAIKTSATGQLYGTALHNNAGSVAGATNQYIASGTYTPTLTNVTNITNSTPLVCQWIRVGNVVTVSGAYQVTPTTTAAYDLQISLPISTTFSSISQCGGVGSTLALNDKVGIAADTSTNKADAQGLNNVVGARNVNFTFTYLVA